MDEGKLSANGAPLVLTARSSDELENCMYLPSALAMGTADDPAPLAEAASAEWRCETGRTTSAPARTVEQNKTASAARGQEKQVDFILVILCQEIESLPTVSNLLTGVNPKHLFHTYLKFNTEDRVQREAMFRGLCGKIGVDPRESRLPSLLYRGFLNPPAPPRSRRSADLEIDDTAGLETCAARSCALALVLCSRTRMAVKNAG
jgi:hypothetical protein